MTTSLASVGFDFSHFSMSSGPTPAGSPQVMAIGKVVIRAEQIFLFYRPRRSEESLGLLGF